MSVDLKDYTVSPQPYVLPKKDNIETQQTFFRGSPGVSQSTVKNETLQSNMFSTDKSIMQEPKYNNNMKANLPVQIHVSKSE